MRVLDGSQHSDRRGGALRTGLVTEGAERRCFPTIPEKLVNLVCRLTLGSFAFTLNRRTSPVRSHGAVC